MSRAMQAQRGAEALVGGDGAEVAQIQRPPQSQRRAVEVHHALGGDFETVVPQPPRNPQRQAQHGDREPGGRRLEPPEVQPCAARDGRCRDRYLTSPSGSPDTHSRGADFET